MSPFSLYFLFGFLLLSKEAFGTGSETKEKRNCPCPRHWAPACGENGKTYNNFCWAKCDGQKVKSKGDCPDEDEAAKQKRPCACPRHIAFVCGENGETYFNSCLMKCEGQKLKKKGQCEEVAAGSTLPWEDKAIQESLKERKETLDCVCGLQNADEGGRVKGRVIGGADAAPYEFGWVASLKPNWPGAKSGQCTASIINDRMVLTAAHCLVDSADLANTDRKFEDRIIKPEKIVLIVNTHKPSGDDRGIVVEVEKYFYHPMFLQDVLRGHYENDIALLVLKKPLEFPAGKQNGIRPICLTKLGEATKTVGENAMITAWGQTRNKGMLEDATKLQKLEVTIDSLDDCRKWSLVNITDSFLCSVNDGTKTSTPGDSGGPLKTKKGDQWTQLGLTSWRDNNMFPDGDGGQIERGINVYQDVTSPVFLRFINYHAQQVGANWCKPKM